MAQGRSALSSAAGGGAIPRLLSVAAGQPDVVLSSADLGARIDRSATWVEARTGIAELRVLGPDSTLDALAYSAATQALARARLETVDLVVSVTCTNPGPVPTIAERIVARVAPAAGVFEINAACAGFPYALAAAESFIRTGQASTVLLVCADELTRLVDPLDTTSSMLFGDGAGAAVIGPSTDPGVHIGPIVWGSDGALASMIEVNDDGFRMDGQGVFRWAVETMQRVAIDACRAAGIELIDLCAFIPHQANARIIDALSSRLDLQGIAVARDVVVSGNTAAASIPIAMAKLLDHSPALSGRLALTVGYGAGLTYAAQVVRLP